MNELKLLDVVALLQDIPEENLQRGEVGTIVEVFADTPEQAGGVLVEFSDREGRAFAVADLRAEQLVKLRYRDAQRDAA
ncbi:MAG: DUF4926 domain-containing protein [Pyrinomonadaceae bacterium]